MESHDQSHLLLCGKEDLVEYIMKLKEDVKDVTKGAESEMEPLWLENHDLKEEIIKLQIQHHKDCIALLELMSKARGCCWTEEKEEE